MIGKLRHSLKEKCPECGRILQLRSKEIRAIRDGLDVILYEDYICCSNRNCWYEEEIKEKKR